MLTEPSPFTTLQVRGSYDGVRLLACCADGLLRRICHHVCPGLASGIVSAHVFNVDECPVMQRARRAVRTLGIDDLYLDAARDKCHCVRCYAVEEPDVNTRSSARCSAPRGWCRIGLSPMADQDFVDKHSPSSTWHGCFHGTRWEAVKGIVHHRGLSLKGRTAADGFRIELPKGHIAGESHLAKNESLHGGFRYGTRKRCQHCDSICEKCENVWDLATSAIAFTPSEYFFTTPSLAYAGHGAYAKHQCVPRAMVQVAFECWQDPASYGKQASKRHDGFELRESVSLYRCAPAKIELTHDAMRPEEDELLVHHHGAQKRSERFPLVGFTDVTLSWTVRLRLCTHVREPGQSHGGHMLPLTTRPRGRSTPGDPQITLDVDGPDAETRAQALCDAINGGRDAIEDVKVTSFDFQAVLKRIVVHGRQIEFRDPGDKSTDKAQLVVNTGTVVNSQKMEFTLCAEVKSVLHMPWEPAPGAAQGHRRCGVELVLETTERHAAQDFVKTVDCLTGRQGPGRGRAAAFRTAEPATSPEPEEELCRVDARGSHIDPYFSNEELERATRRDNVVVPHSLLVHVVGQEEEFGAIDVHGAGD